MSKKGFTDNDDELLVELVSQYRVIYDQKHRDFRNVRVKNNAWKRIGECLKKDEDQCKKRWKDVRDNYWKIVRRDKLPGSTPASRSSKKWPLFEKLTFLGDTDRDHPSFSCVSEQELPSFSCIPEQELRHVEVVLSDKEGDMEIDHPMATASFSSTSDSTPTSPSFPIRSSRRNAWSTIKKREQKELELLRSLIEKKLVEDDVDLFMRSIALSVKKLPPHLINKAKLGILNFVTELEDCASHNIIIEDQSDISIKNKLKKT